MKNPATDAPQPVGSSLRGAVRAAYSAIAENPTGDVPFPTGRHLAEGVGYPADLLDTLPTDAVDAFAGVSAVPLFAEIPDDAIVLDLGCGAGMDTLIAARRARAGRVVGVDFSESMLSRARLAAGEARAGNVDLRLADAESIPLPDRSVDVAIVNGIFNLNLARDRIFAELGRVVRHGGRLFVAELILVSPLSVEELSGEQNWFT